MRCLEHRGLHSRRLLCLYKPRVTGHVFPLREAFGCDDSPSHGGLGARGHIRTLTEGPPKAEPVGHRAGLATGLHASLPDSDCECQTPSGAPSVTQWDTRDHLARRWAELPFAQYTQPLLSTTIPQGAPDRCPQGVLMTLESSRRPGKGGWVGVSQDFGIL